MSHRLLLVHAHPDDEAIPTGVTMARYAADGAQVTLVTCTLGEEGDVVADDLHHLASHHGDSLGEHRLSELAAACAALGVSDYRILGGAGRWRDSGMADTPANDNPACFWRADLDEAAGAMVEVMRDVRPQVVITYDENGDYGHPDHIQAHRVTMRACDLAGDAAPAKVYYTAFPKSVLRMGFEYFKARDEPGGFFEGIEDPDDLPFGTPDELVTTVIDGSAYVERKYAAMRAHRSQIAEDGIFFALPEDVGVLTWGREYFRLVRGDLGTPRDANGRETDLFAGLPS